MQGRLQGCTLHANFARCIAIGCGVLFVGGDDASDGFNASTAIIYWRCVGREVGKMRAKAYARTRAQLAYGRPRPRAL